MEEKLVMADSAVLTSLQSVPSVANGRIRCDK
jgi:hypothetical protein